MEYEDYDEKNVLNGPIRPRKCTDIICLIIWILFWGLIIGVAIFSFVKGDLKNIAQPFDSDGNPCGKDNQVDHQFLYINQPQSTKLKDHMVCVKQCPVDEDSTIDCVPNSDINNCSNLNVYKSFGFINRICIPLKIQDTDTIKSNMNISYSQEVVEDIKDAWVVFIIILFISVLVSFIYFYLLQCCAGVMVVLMIIVGLGCFIGFGVFCWLRYRQLLAETEFNEEIANNYKVTAIVMWVLAGVFALLICCLWKRIKLAIQMIKAAADFVTDKKSVLLSPIIVILFMGIFIMLWVLTFAFVFSVGEIRYDPGDMFGDMVWTKTHTVFVYLTIFALLWGVSFLMSTNIFVISVMCSGWYFGRYDGKEVGLCTAFFWAWFYHLGSLAFGSLIIAILWAVQLILKYMYQKAKETGQNSAALKMAICCVNCLERIMKFLNKHAYIEVGLRCYSFCGAAAKSVQVMTTNFLRFTALAGLVELFLIMGTIIISVCTTLIGYGILKGYGHATNIEFETIGPLVIIFMIAFVISMLFNNVFDVSADTMLHCYVLDETLNFSDGYQKCPEKLKNIAQSMNDHQRLNENDHDQYNDNNNKNYYS